MNYKMYRQVLGKVEAKLGVAVVCLFVCLSDCLSVCLSSKTQRKSSSQKVVKSFRNKE